jgi:tRNA (guanine-N7-)-methyltransferase
MKPEDLKSPFSWDERCVALHDRVWYIPGYFHDYESFVFPGWNHADVFGNRNPVHVEYCSGNGAWIAARAEANPHINWVAVEKKFERVRKIWSKLKNRKLNNLIVVCGEGCNATDRYFPEGSISQIYINFPDPWPKKRHIKNRIIQPIFIGQMHRILANKGEVTLVTDDLVYSDWMIKMMRGDGRFSSCFPEPYFVTDYEGYGTSYFEELWRGEGKYIHYHKFAKL